jgi:hypothetical protein
MNNNEKTIWKNSSFSMSSDTKENMMNQDNRLDSLPTSNELQQIEEKMVAFHKRKRYKENFKNIEELQNIYDVKETPIILDNKPNKKQKKKSLTWNDFLKCNKKKETMDNPKEKQQNKKEKSEKSEKKETKEKKKEKEQFKSNIKEGLTGNSGFDEFLSVSYNIFEYWYYIIDLFYYALMFFYNSFKDTIYNFNYKLIKQYSTFGSSKNVEVSFDLSNKTIAKGIDEEVSGKNNKKNETNTPEYINEDVIKNDTNILTEIIISILIFPISILMTYNWFYLICYYDEFSVQCLEKNDSCANKLSFICCRPADDSQRIPITWGTDRIVNLFVDCIIAPLAIIDQYLLGTTANVLNPLKSYEGYEDPKYTLPYTYPSLLFMIYQTFLAMGLSTRILQKFLMALLSFFILYHMSFFSSIHSIIHNDTYNIPFIICGVILFIYFIWNLGQLMILDIGYFCRDAFKESPTPYIFIAAFFMEIICFFTRIIVFFFSLKISVLITLLYLWAHSLFGIWWYKIEKTSGTQKIPESFEDKLINMNIFINKDLEFFKKNKDCKDPNILIKLIKYFTLALANNMFVYFFIFLLLFNFDLCRKMESTNVQVCTMYLLTFLFTLCIFKIIFFTNSGES